MQLFSVQMLLNRVQIAAAKLSLNRLSLIYINSNCHPHETHQIYMQLTILLSEFCRV